LLRPQNGVMAIYVPTMGTSEAKRPDRPCEVCRRAMTLVSTFGTMGQRRKISVFRCEHCLRMEVDKE
jgi:hypothetical protein